MNILCRVVSTLLLATFAAGLVACASSNSPGPATIKASLLIEASPEDATWFRDLNVPDDTDAYQLLEIATSGDIEADWFPTHRSHFVTAVLGAPGVAPRFWLAFVWDDLSLAWLPLPMGADLYQIEDGRVLAWALLDTSGEFAKVPQSQP